MRELSDVRLKVAALVLLPLIPAALALLFVEELLALILLGALAALCVWIAPRMLVDRGKLLSAAEPVAVTRCPAEGDRDRGGEIGKLFSSVTHDLRTPLTSIKAASTLMLDHERAIQTNDRRELLETIRDSADVLDRLITNSVQLARSRNAGLQPQKVRAALDEVASRTLERMRRSLRDHRVVLVIPEDLPEMPVDVVQLEHALTNVLENAAKFSPVGSEIALILSRSNGSVLIRVEDRGTGIPQEQRDHVVEPFVKLGGGGGAGLGLSVSRAIVEAHGGHLRIEDPPGGGTAVVLELPLRPAVSLPDLTTESRG